MRVGCVYIRVVVVILIHYVIGGDLCAGVLWGRQGRERQGKRHMARGRHMWVGGMAVSVDRQGRTGALLGCVLLVQRFAPEGKRRFLPWHDGMT